MYTPCQGTPSAPASQAEMLFAPVRTLAKIHTPVILVPSSAYTRCLFTTDTPAGQCCSHGCELILPLRCDTLQDPTAAKGTRMFILCAILQYDPRTVEGKDTRHFTFPVLFQVPSTAEYMDCSSSKISIQSIRWPQSQFTSIDMPSYLS